MGTWSIEVARSIYEGKWLSVQYKNMNNEITYFWCAITDIEPNKRRLIADVFNYEKGERVQSDYQLNFDSIIRASVIEGTCYSRPEKLIAKMTENYRDYQFLSVHSVDERLLSYYLECLFLDSQDEEQEYILIDEFDYHVLYDRRMVLEKDQFEKVLGMLRNALKLKDFGRSGKVEYLQMNYLSIESKNKGLIPLVYFNVIVNIKERSLYISPQYQFNRRTVFFEGQSIFLIEKYIDSDFEHFINNFSELESDFLEQIQENKDYDERINQMPYFFTRSMFIRQNLRDEFDKISKKYINGTLQTPLGAFFGSYQRNKRYTKRPVFLINENTNLNQLRVVYNAMNEDIQYVQGPPGTGKTVSITNIVASCFFNDQKTLVVSNNNQAVDNVITKIKSLKLVDDEYFLPYLRLGSDEHINTTLKSIHEYLIKHFPNKKRKYVDFEKFRNIKNQLKNKMSGISDLVKDYEEFVEISEQIESLKDLKSKILAGKESDDLSIQLNITGLDAQIEHLKSTLPDCSSDESVYQQFDVDPVMVKEFFEILSNRNINYLFETDNQSILETFYKNDPKTRLDEFRLFIKTDEGLRRLLKIFPVIFSTNISCTKLGENDEVFDLMVMDEASQCNVAVSLVPMARCKRACFIGDQNQLRPVVTITQTDNERLMNNFDIPPHYDYLNNSIMTSLLKIDTLSKFVLLKKHYRCHKKIIDFSNKKYYSSALEIESNNTTIYPLKLIDIKDTSSVMKNTSPHEVEILIRELSKETDFENVAVITPFRNQAKLIRQELARAGLSDIRVGTIHTFQGDEREKIYVSPAITEQTTSGTYNWLKLNQELINVMTTRPRSNLIVIADKDRIMRLSDKKNDDFSELISYIHSNGTTDVTYCNNELFEQRISNYKYYNTQVEQDLLETISHYITTNRQFTVRNNVKITDVLKLDEVNDKLFLFGKKARFDFVLYDLARKPLLAIEIVYHSSRDQAVRNQSNVLKAELCERNSIRLFEIPNDYVRRYKMIRDSIVCSL